MPENSQPEKPWGLILAAGSGSRLAAVVGGCPKQFLCWRDVPLYWRGARHEPQRRGGRYCFCFPP